MLQNAEVIRSRYDSFVWKSFPAVKILPTLDDLRCYGSFSCQEVDARWLEIHPEQPTKSRSSGSGRCSMAAGVIESWKSNLYIAWTMCKVSVSKYTTVRTCFSLYSLYTFYIVSKYTTSVSSLLCSRRHVSGSIFVCSGDFFFDARWSLSHITLRKGSGFALAPRGNMRATNLPTMPVRQRMFVRDLPSVWSYRTETGHMLVV